MFGPHPRSQPRPIDPAAFSLQPGGRWARVLTLLVGGAYRPSEILFATDPGKHSRKVERVRIHRALMTMREVGLIQNAGAHGFTATARGRAEVEALAARKPASASEASHA